MDNFFCRHTHHNFPRQSCFHNHSNHYIYHSQKYIYLFPYISMYLLGKLKMKKSQITDFTKWNSFIPFLVVRLTEFIRLSDLGRIMASIPKVRRGVGTLASPEIWGWLKVKSRNFFGKKCKKKISNFADG